MGYFKNILKTNLKKVSCKRDLGKVERVQKEESKKKPTDKN